MRLHRLQFLACIVAMCGLSMLLAKPSGPVKKEEPKADKASQFKAIEINAEVTANDPNDPETMQPAKKYTVKLNKDQTYVFKVESTDFEPIVRLLDKEGKGLAREVATGVPSQLVYSATSSDEFHTVAATGDGNLGKFKLTVHALVLKGEEKAREVGANGLVVNGTLGEMDMAGVNKVSKVYSVQLSAGQTYSLEMASPNLDCYLYLFDGKNKLLAQDDDSGGGANGLDSKIIFRAPQDGVYHLLATSFTGDETGDFILSVNRQ